MCKDFIRLVSQIVLFVVLLTGCVHQPVWKPTGFLGEQAVYDQMRFNPNYDLMVWMPRQNALRKYRSFVVRPVVIIDEKARGPLGISTEEKSHLAERLRKKLIRELDQKNALIEVPAADMAVIRIALTDLSRKGAAMELEVLDSTSKQRVIAAMDARYGGGSLFGEELSRWGYADEVMTRWAGSIRQMVTVSRGDSQASPLFGGSPQ